jgi:hypothetical protein
MISLYNNLKFRIPLVVLEIMGDSNFEVLESITIHVPMLKIHWKIRSNFSSRIARIQKWLYL